MLRALRALNRRNRSGGKVVASPGEILGEDDDKAFNRDSATDGTRVRTAVAWLEEAQLLTREENHVRVFPSSLRVSSLEDVRHKLKGKPIDDRYRRSLTSVVATLIRECRGDPDARVVLAGRYRRAPPTGHRPTDRLQGTKPAKSRVRAAPVGNATSITSA